MGGAPTNAYSCAMHLAAPPSTHPSPLGLEGRVVCMLLEASQLVEVPDPRLIAERLINELTERGVAER